MNLPLNKGVQILTSHECGLIALNKPTGILAHPNRKGEKKGPAILKGKFDEEGECFYDLGEEASCEKVYLLNRIDSATSGVILVSVNEEIAKTMRALFEAQRVEKVYLALLKGRPPGAPDVWVDRLERSKSRSGSLMVQRGGNQLAKTRIRWMCNDENRLGLSLMRLQPYTGRTHQLRVQCGMRRHPILGDRKYGDFRFNRRMAEIIGMKRLFLHAHEVQVQFPWKGKQVKFKAEAPMPEAFEKVIQLDKELLGKMHHNIANAAINRVQASVRSRNPQASSSAKKRSKSRRRSSRG